MARNPKWTRDELILALDLYFRVPRGSVNASHEKIIELSEVLNRLRSAAPEDPMKYRNPNGVGMKLHNFSRLDEAVGGVGLSHGGRFEEEIWKEFAGNRAKLTEEAAAVRRRVAASRD
jgi:5-methylcytosine-specific restriction protein A